MYGRIHSGGLGPTLEHPDLKGQGEVWTRVYPWLQAQSVIQLPRLFYWWRNGSLEKWFVQTHPHKGSSFLKYIPIGGDSKLFWVVIFKTHHKTQLLSWPYNSVNENDDEILSSYWNQPSSIQVSSSQRSYLHFARVSCLKRECFAVLPGVVWVYNKGAWSAVDTTMVRSQLRDLATLS